ncbi:hypothetical protein [Sphingomonas xanthus]|uniref:Uncharacterized protein n=1 Tax=Sphingomonas xanthus TaxID=2594473 RepID=A0A516ISG3_9SPHN|nr:hypothetical protein [Sphingomonas xanthus]QDP19827.1 hypothetical protein FMM02_07575 [Sphingomonas xanthus]
MARFDGHLKAAGDAAIDADELLSALVSLPAAAHSGPSGRNQAIACFLSGSEGWRDAKKALKGTFASGAEASWLTGGKD